MTGTKLAGGPTQDEIMAVSLFKLGPARTDTVLEIGCGTGKVSVALAMAANTVYSVDLRPEAVTLAQETAQKSGMTNIRFACIDAARFLEEDRVFDCAFIGGTKDLGTFLPVLAKKVRRTIVINAVLLGTLESAVTTLKQLGLFVEVVQVQVSRSHDLAGSLMFCPIDPVFIIVARGAACS